MRKNTCLICKKPCQSNQIAKCLHCNLHAHRKYAKIGLNFGVKNYICTICHHKKGRSQKSPPLQNERHEHQNININISNSSDRNAETNRQNGLRDSPEVFDLDALNERIFSANQKKSSDWAH